MKIKKMNNPDKFFNEKFITLNLKAKTKEQAINELAEMLYSGGKIKSVNGFIKSVIERENTVSTYCGSDIAIPHAASRYVIDAAFAFGRSNGFSWGEGDGNVNYIFLLAIPEVKGGDQSKSAHIAMMSSIAELALEEDVRQKWAIANTVEEILETFNSVLNIKK
ncbi:MAG: PTS sugar transporter subunit IIA [Bacteroidales bacterium]|nr:MAG: PTS sugar transporter subunit IIA [Bacteroidales bacterium]